MKTKYITKDELERFYDNLKMSKVGQDKFKISSKNEARCFVSKIKEYLKRGQHVAIDNREFKTEEEFENWLDEDYNVELGTDILKNK
ncbi:MAG: hypothetical protein E6649_05440 [Paeniclostridium sordellii]|nr:hypothetical protein [Paeniclostridium sordellii]